MIKIVPETLQKQLVLEGTNLLSFSSQSSSKEVNSNLFSNLLESLSANQQEFDSANKQDIVFQETAGNSTKELAWQDDFGQPDFKTENFGSEEVRNFEQNNRLPEEEPASNEERVNLSEEERNQANVEEERNQDNVEEEIVKDATPALREEQPESEHVEKKEVEENKELPSDQEDKKVSQKEVKQELETAKISLKGTAEGKIEETKYSSLKNLLQKLLNTSHNPVKENSKSEAKEDTKAKLKTEAKNQTNQQIDKQLSKQEKAVIKEDVKQVTLAKETTKESQESEDKTWLKKGQNSEAAKVEVKSGNKSTELKPAVKLTAESVKAELIKNDGQHTQPQVNKEVRKSAALTDTPKPVQTETKAPSEEKALNKTSEFKTRIKSSEAQVKGQTSAKKEINSLENLLEKNKVSDISIDTKTKAHEGVIKEVISPKSTNKESFFNKDTSFKNPALNKTNKEAGNVAEEKTSESKFILSTDNKQTNPAEIFDFSSTGQNKLLSKSLNSEQTTPSKQVDFSNTGKITPAMSDLAKGENVKSTYKPAEAYSRARITEDKIIEQIVTKAKFSIKGETKEMKLQLDPPNLGQVKMKLSMNNNNVLTAKVEVENSAVRTAIQNNISNLKESLEEQGVKVDKFEVLVKDNQDTAQGEKGEQGQGNTHHKAQNILVDDEAILEKNIQEEVISHINKNGNINVLA